MTHTLASCMSWCFWIGSQLNDHLRLRWHWTLAEFSYMSLRRSRSTRVFDRVCLLGQTKGQWHDFSCSHILTFTSQWRLSIPVLFLSVVSCPWKNPWWLVTVACFLPHRRVTLKRRLIKTGNRKERWKNERSGMERVGKHCVLCIPLVSRPSLAPPIGVCSSHVLWSPHVALSPLRPLFRPQCGNPAHGWRLAGRQAGAADAIPRSSYLLRALPSIQKREGGNVAARGRMKKCLESLDSRFSSRASPYSAFGDRMLVTSG